MAACISTTCSSSRGRRTVRAMSLSADCGRCGSACLSMI
nr:MAG TPA: hypothetical protein [Caudoviricetes sp.]